MYKLGILNGLGYFKEEEGKWAFVNGDGAECSIDNDNVENILDQYKDADPDIDSDNPQTDYVSNCGIDLNRIDEEDIQEINKWLENL